MLGTPCLETHAPQRAFPSKRTPFALIAWITDLGPVVRSIRVSGTVVGPKLQTTCFWLETKGKESEREIDV